MNERWKNRRKELMSEGSKKLNEWRKEERNELTNKEGMKGRKPKEQKSEWLTEVRY